MQGAESGAFLSPLQSQHWYEKHFWPIMLERSRVPSIVLKFIEGSID